MAYYRFFEPAYIDGKYYPAGVHKFNKRKFEEDYIKEVSAPAAKDSTITLPGVVMDGGILKQKAEVAKKLQERKKLRVALAEDLMGPLA